MLMQRPGQRDFLLSKLIFINGIEIVNVFSIKPIFFENFIDFHYDGHQNSV